MILYLANYSLEDHKFIDWLIDNEAVVHYMYLHVFFEND